MVIKTVGVVGAGTMGGGIAQLCAGRGFSAKLYDISKEILERAKERIEKSIDTGVTKGKITPEAAAKTKRSIAYVLRLEDLAAADIVIEAATENLGLKQEIFSRLDALVASERVIATNTSSLPVQEIGAKAKHPERILGVHFFNPPPVMKLVEMIRPPRLDEKHYQTAKKFALDLGKTVVEVKDVPGFIVNRVLRPYYIEAFRLLEAGKTTIKEMDEAVVKLGGVPMGPCALVDFIGMDVNLAVTSAIFDGLGRPERLKPAALQEQLVKLDYLGPKVGRGFYLYRNRRAAGENPEVLKILPPVKNRLPPEALWAHLKRAIRQEAEMLFNEGTATKEDINTAVRLGANFSKGPFEMSSDEENRNRDRHYFSAEK
ncbi:MAG: 3-hydroxybutyryl-CoA dehydrogenase [Elusimicrobia bacterium]|nr:3-hydroxybutyryl-CoA dehydrogenase [Elusimicrobiota bacterium]